jgi:hypothetical protein
LLYVSLRIGWGSVFVTHIAVPWATPSIPSVTRNDGIAKTATSAPLTEPTTSPVTRPTTIPATIPWSWIVIAVVTDARPAVAPTERSICAAPITNVIATAMIEIVAVARRMLSRFVDVRNPLPCSVTLK